jgi:hypothetical protein
MGVGQGYIHSQSSGMGGMFNRFPDDRRCSRYRGVCHNRRRGAMSLSFDDDDVVREMA